MDRPFRFASASIFFASATGVYRLVGKDFVKGFVPLQPKRGSGFPARGIHVRSADKPGSPERLEASGVASEPFLCYAVFGDAAETNQCIPDFHSSPFPIFSHIARILSTDAAKKFFSKSQENAATCGVTMHFGF